MSDAAPRITISICTYNRYDVLPKAIASATRQSLPAAQYRILVVDNSPDHAQAENFGAQFAAIANLSYIVETTPGLSNARNVSANLCGTEFVAFMDDDAIAGPDWLVQILTAFERFGASVMAVGGQVGPIWGAPRPPWVHDSLLGYLSVVNWGGQARIAAAHEWFAGTNIALRTAAILEHGGFAVNLGRTGSGATLLSNEEMQLVERIRAAGGALVYAPDAYVEHLVDPRRLSRSWFRKRAAWQAVSDVMMEREKKLDEAKSYWPRVVDYFNALPPHERTIRGLVHETDDPELFNWQLGATYMMTVLQLAGFDGVTLD